MPKKTRVADTIAGAIDAMTQAASPPPEPPAYVRLPDAAKPFWNALIASRAREEWTKSDLVLAAQLARCQLSIEQEQQALDEEGTVVQNDRGTMVTNPRFRAVAELKQSQLATFKALSLHAGAKADKRDIAKRRGAFLGASRAREELQEEDLIPT